MSTEAVLEDLEAEQQALDAVTAPLSSEAWSLPTPSPGWTVAHQIAHLTYFDEAAARSITDPAAFAVERDRFIAAAVDDPDSMDTMTIADRVGMDPADLLAAWRTARSGLSTAAGTLTDGQRVQWYGPSMSARSFLTARLMEVWAHGQDVVDALDDAGVDHVHRRATDRIRHVAHLGVVTRTWSYAVRGAVVPDAEVRVELTAPGGGLWTWGPAEADDLVRGPAAGFVAVVTQRRNVADTDLQISGAAATEWMSIAQAFAGGPTEGPAPRG